MVVAVVTSPVSATKAPVGTKLNEVIIGIAKAGEAAKPTPTTPASNAFRKLWKPMMKSPLERRSIGSEDQNSPLVGEISVKSPERNIVTHINDYNILASDS